MDKNRSILKKENEIMFNSVIKDFHKEIVKDYPNMTFEQVRSICLAPFGVLKREVDEDTYNPVRIMHLGLFGVSESKAMNVKKYLESRRDKEDVSEKIRNLEVYIGKMVKKKEKG